MKRIFNIGKYLLIPLCICLFGIFIYPTLYKYDKLEQKYPVQINRITGETKVLTPRGWQNSEDYNYASTEMEKYKDEIMKKIENQREEIIEEVLLGLQEELEYRIGNHSVVENLPGDNTDFEPVISEETNIDRSAFGKGDTMETVEAIMGTPERITAAGDYETWFYKFSSINFKNGEVTGWSNNSQNLKLK